MHRGTRFLIVVSLAVFAWTHGGFSTPARADAPRLFPQGKTPNDRRLGELKDLNQFFPFEVPPTRQAWQQRAERLRRQLLVSQGLWPMPTKTPPNAVVHGKIDRGEYTVEKVFLESFPGHFVTGSLYRPKGKEGKLPGVLCPHGHWPNGRFLNQSDAERRQQIDSVAERFESAAHSPLQARCVHLARLGCVVFHYDMIGYADSVQLAHRPGGREHMNTPENWGFFSPQAELRLQTMMGLQTYNSIRALDWFGELPDVDPARIGVTGASGGGTQTFILCAVDPRPAVAFPAVMVSTSMQGGCTCENASLLRVGTGNIEIAALFAPKPQAMTAADDWTVAMTHKGFPELQRLYDLYDARDKVFLQANLQYPHNYNAVSRAAMYRWFNQHLKLGHPAAKLIERDFTLLSQAEMSVWDEKHPKPRSGDDYERSLLNYMTEDSRRQLAALTPKDGPSLAQYRRIVGGAFDAVVGRQLPAKGDLEWEEPLKNDRGEYYEYAGLLRNKPCGEELPLVFLHPKKWNKQVVIWPHENGKAGLYGSDGSPKPAVRKLLDGGCTVVGVDLLYQGEFLADGKPLEKARLNGSGRDAWKHYAGYTYGYNQSLFAQRASDLLTVVAFCRGYEGKQRPEKVHLIGLDGAGIWAAAARAQAGEAVERAAIDTAGTRFAKITSIDHVNFLPGSVKYGDVPGLLALSAPQELWIAGEPSLPDVVTAAYRSAGKLANATLFRGAKERREEAAVEWILH
jgi:dienelactone hydrolase